MSCKNCDSRNESCHSTCTDYADFIKQNEIRRQVLFKKNEAKDYMNRRKRELWAYEKTR